MYDPDFSLDDFKRWMKNKDTEENTEDRMRRQSNLIGISVESKIDEDRIQVKMEVVEGDLEDLSMDFYENGGVISDIDGKRFLIEVDSGSFFIHKAFVRRI